KSPKMHYLTDEKGMVLADFTGAISEGRPYVTPFRFFKPGTLFDDLSGAELCIPYTAEGGEKRVLVMKGFFPSDPLNLQRVAGWLSRKSNEVSEILEHVPVPSFFKQKYINQYSARDMITKSPKEIEKDVRESWGKLRELKKMRLPTLARHFAFAEVKEQVRILSLLLMDQNPANGHFIFSMTAQHSPTFKMILRDCLHFSLQEQLDLSEESLKAMHEKIANMNADDVSLEQRIMSSKMDESAMQKAMDKMKSIKGNGSDADKAEAWVKGLLKIPFGNYTPEPVSMDASRPEKLAYINRVRGTLDSAVHGHEDAKKMLEGLVAQWIRSGKSSGEIIGIHGPPGNGKTTIAKHGIAKALGRPFGFLPLGGVTDSSYLIGHGYTYVGSTWGRIVDILMETGTMNPVIYIDELDKISKTPKGEEIYSVLTHLLDPTQNNEFSQDKYFAGLKFDLSKALIVVSYNDPDKIDPILLNRITKIKTGALTTKDKVVVARDYLMPAVRDSFGFKPDEITISDSTLNYLVLNYALADTGARRVKQLLFQIVRDLNLDLFSDPNRNLPVEITKEMIVHYLKEPRIREKKILDKPIVGFCNGLYATVAGFGGLTVIQAMHDFSEHKLSLELTGNQGEVMKESMRVARTVAWNILPKKYKDKIRNGPAFGLHIHAPEGGVKKDGPSAGGAITSAMVSQMTGVPIRNDVAMTGEIDGAGRITAIGGVYSKLKGAKDAGARLVLIPEENERDLREALQKDPDLVDENFKVKLVNNIHDLLGHVLVPNNLEFEDATGAFDLEALADAKMNGEDDGKSPE
ncbi:Lon protease homolog, partial [Chlamydiales bacterium SCGC AG-110-M15]